MTIRVVQAGYGGVGRRRAEVIANDPRAQLVGVCEPDPGAREAARARFGAAIAVEPRLEPLLDGADAVIVSTPNADHVPMALAALAADAHVLVEKPLARSSADAMALFEAAPASGRVVKMGANHQFFPSVIAALGQCAGGRIGALQGASIRIGHGRFTELPAWFRDPARAGGGTLLDNGSHAALLALALFDLGGGRPATASCVLETRAGIDVAASGWVRNDAGVAVDLEATWVGEGGYHFQVEIRGDSGTIEIRNPGQWTLNNQAQPIVDRPSWTVDTDDLLTAIETGGRPQVGLEQAMGCLRVLDGLYASAGRGEPVELPG